MGPSDGVPGDDDENRDDFRSMVFDESFVEAAQIQEYSAKERLEDDEHAPVHRRAVPPLGSGHGGDRSADGGSWSGDDGGRTRLGVSKQGIVLMLLITLAFGTAVYMGVRAPYPSPSAPPTAPMRITLLPLAPRDTVPGGSPADLYAHSPAAEFRTGADGVTLPQVRRVGNFSASQVLAGLTTVKDYVVRSSLDPDVLTGGEARSVRLMLDPAQHPQFDRSLERPRTDGRHAATGWMIRFDRSKVALADERVRVEGRLRFEETPGNALEIVADHVFVYALRPATASKEPAKADGKDGASLFTVRREVRFHIDHADLRDRQLAVEQVAMTAGPLPCSSDPAGNMTPLLAGQEAKDDRAAGTDPYARGKPSASLCGVLSPGAQPNLAE